MLLAIVCLVAAVNSQVLPRTFFLVPSVAPKRNRLPHQQSNQPNQNGSLHVRASVHRRQRQSPDHPLRAGGRRAESSKRRRSSSGGKYWRPDWSKYVPSRWNCPLSPPFHNMFTEVTHSLTRSFVRSFHCPMVKNSCCRLLPIVFLTPFLGAFPSRLSLPSFSPLSAAGVAKASGVVAPEKVVNPYGSAAGAGSGDFHVYRHARARELERIATLEHSERQRIADQEFRDQLERARQHEAERTEQRRKKRQRQKEAQKRRTNLLKAGVRLDGGEEGGHHDAIDDEFTYEPIGTNLDGTSDAAGATAAAAAAVHSSTAVASARDDARAVAAADASADPSLSDLATAPPRVASASTEGRSAGAGDDDNSDSDDDSSVGPQPAAVGAPPPAKRSKLE